jgi:hypothetical protein
MTHPLKQSADIAKLIQMDHVAAGMIKEHIKPAELRGILDIDKSTEEFFEDVTNEQLWEELTERIKVTNYRPEPELVRALALVKEFFL